MAEKTGLFNKYVVSRQDGRDRPGEDKDNAEYFVLDVINDHFAWAALGTYAENCKYHYPELSRDLYAWLARSRG